MRPSTDIAARMARLGGVYAPPVIPSSALDALPDAIADRLSRPLAERLARLRPRLGRTQAREVTDTEVALTTGGLVLAPGLIRIDRVFRLPHRHGERTLRQLPASERYGLLDPALAGVRDPANLWLFDTETNGLSGGTGTIAFIIGAARFTSIGLQLTQFLMLAFAAERAMLAALAATTAGASGLVSYNGRSFDSPLLQARYRMHAMPDPFKGLSHLDLLYWVRRYRPRDWPDARLATIESKWLKFERTNDIAGADVPRAWQQWLHARDASALDGVLRHNRSDLITLACVLETVMVPARRERSRLGPAQAGIFSV